MPEEKGADFFLEEMAKHHAEYERKHEQLSARMERLERRGHGQDEQLIDNKTIGMLIVISVIPIALQVIGMLLAKHAKVE